MKKLNKLDKYIIFSIIVLLIYTITSIILFIIKDIEMSTLTPYVYGTFGGEFFLAALIKVFNIRNETRNGFQD